MGSTKSDERPGLCAIRVSGPPITHVGPSTPPRQVFRGQQTLGCARRAADRGGISGFLLASLGRINRVVLRRGEWPRGCAGFVSR
jgi:hypothetical protein